MVSVTRKSTLFWQHIKCISVRHTDRTREFVLPGARRKHFIIPFLKSKARGPIMQSRNNQFCLNWLFKENEQMQAAALAHNGKQRELCSGYVMADFDVI